MDTFIENEGGAVSAVKWLLQKIVTEKLADAVFVLARTPYSSLPMPMLISDPDQLASADPFAPAAPFNAARQAVSLLRHDTDKKIAFLLRPCEMRALVELVKLKQAVLEAGIFIGMECPGRMENALYLEKAGEDPDLSLTLLNKDDAGGMLTSACSACDRFLPEGVDLILSIFGADVSKGIGVSAKTGKGNHVLETLDCPNRAPSSSHETEIDRVLKQRREAKSALISQTSEKINNIESFERLIANCLNCYNCRVACPVCYCKECVFVTDVFAHEPELLIRRSSKKGRIKMPTETTMFHMTRLAHIGHACVACGHCTSVCPSNIPVADFFITVGSKVQEVFDYEPGRDVNEPIPYLVFEEKNKSGH